MTVTLPITSQNQECIQCAVSSCLMQENLCCPNFQNTSLVGNFSPQIRVPDSHFGQFSGNRANGVVKVWYSCFCKNNPTFIGLNNHASTTERTASDLLYATVSWLWPQPLNCGMKFLTLIWWTFSPLDPRSETIRTCIVLSVFIAVLKKSMHLKINLLRLACRMIAARVSVKFLKSTFCM